MNNDPKKKPPSPVDPSADLYKKDYAPAIKYFLKQFTARCEGALRRVDGVSYQLRGKLFAALQEELGEALGGVDQVHDLEELARLAAIERTEAKASPAEVQP